MIAMIGMIVMKVVHSHRRLSLGLLQGFFKASSRLLQGFFKAHHEPF
jgi:hypothetical protein